MRHKLAILMLNIIFCFSSITGCASQYGTQRTQVNYYPQCYQPISDLRNRENQVSSSTVGGAVLGALGGALIGLLSGGDNRMQGALVGAAIGGASGAVTGNIYGRQAKEQDDNRRLASYYQNMEGDIYNMDISTAAARTALQCYDSQFQALLAAIRSKKIDRRAAASRFAEISTGREEAINILGNVAYTGDSLERQYEQAFVEEERDMRRKAQAESGVRTQARAKAIRTVRQKNKEITQKTAQVREEKAMAESATVQQTQSINEAMARLEDLKI